MAGIAALTKLALKRLSKQRARAKTAESAARFDNPMTIFNNADFYRRYRADEIFSPTLGKTGTRDELLDSIYTGTRGIDKTTGKPVSAVARGHRQAKVYRKGQDTWKQLNSEKEVDNYVKKGTERQIGQIKGKESLYIHPDLITPKNLEKKVDFSKHGEKVRFLGEDTPFTTQAPGVLTNTVRNQVYHQHLENRLTRWLTEKKLIEKAFKDKKISKGRMQADMETANSHISNIERDMRKLGLETIIYDAPKKKFNYFGKKYGSDVDKQFEGMLEDIPKNYLLRNPPYKISEGFDKSKKAYWQKPVGHAGGGLIKKGLKKLLDCGGRSTKVIAQRSGDIGPGI